VNLNPDGSAVLPDGGQVGPHMFEGLFDTGASTTCISARVVNDVALNPTGIIEMMGTTGRKTVNEYFFGLGFVVGEVPQTTGFVSSQVEWTPVRGSFFEGSGSGFDVLIGRDILCQGVFTMSFDGHVTFSR
jgi:hypothetical protein